MATGTAISLTIGAALSAGWTQAFSQASKSVASFSEKAIANFGAAQQAEKRAAAELNKLTILIGNKQPTQAQASALETLNKQLERAKKRLADATEGVSAWLDVSAAARKVRFSEAVQAASNSFSALTQKVGSASTLLSTLFFDTAAKTAQGIDEMNRTAESLGISVETLQRFQFAGAKAGISAEKLSTHLTEMSKRIAEAAAGTGEAGKVLESLNLSASALNKFDAATKFEILAKAIGDIKNESEQIRITDKLFGGEAIKTLPAMFRQGWAQIAADMNAANDHILKNANAETLAHDYVTAIERVCFSFNVLKQEAVVSLMPLLGKVMNGISDVVSKLTWLAPAIASITSALIVFKGIALAVASAIALKNAVLVASAAVINAWALACKAASVMAGIFNSVLNVMRAGTLAHVAAMGIAKTATLAWSAVTKAAAAAQWLLNVALTANPIGLVIAAITALVAAIVWCWKNCDTFRTGVLAVFSAVAKGARWAFEGVLKIFEKVRAAFKSVLGAVADVAGFFGIGDSTISIKSEQSTALSEMPIAAAPAIKLDAITAPVAAVQQARELSPARTGKIASGNVITDNSTQNFTIVQQPGEDANALAQRISEILAGDYATATAAAI